MNVTESIAKKRVHQMLNGVIFHFGNCEHCGTKTTVNSWGGLWHCPTCRVRALQNDEHYSRITCETVFSSFGDRFREQYSPAYRAIMPVFWEHLHDQLSIGTIQFDRTRLTGQPVASCIICPFISVHWDDVIDLVHDCEQVRESNR
jgi:ribosomal protein L37AE/L43A